MWAAHRVSQNRQICSEQQRHIRSKRLQGLSWLLYITTSTHNHTIMHASMGRWQCIRRRQCKLTIGVHTCSSKQPAAAAGSRATNRAVSHANSRGPDKLMQLRREPGTPKPSMKALSKRTHRKARCCRCCVLVEKQTHSSNGAGLHPKRHKPMDACVPARPLHRFINEAKLTHIACVTDLKNQCKPAAFEHLINAHLSTADLVK